MAWKAKGVGGVRGIGRGGVPWGQGGDGGAGVCQGGIWVITACNKQVQKLRVLLRAKGYWGDGEVAVREVQGFAVWGGRSGLLRVALMKEGGGVWGGQAARRRRGGDSMGCRGVGSQSRAEGQESGRFQKLRVLLRAKGYWGWRYACGRNTQDGARCGRENVGLGREGGRGC